jgi:anti-sigma-K factor RskA
VLTTLAFNQAKRESELAAYSADELRAMVGEDQANVRVLDGNAGGAALAKLRAEQTGQPLWRYCLALALLCLLAEALLLRFGRRAAARPTVATA